MRPLIRVLLGGVVALFVFSIYSDNAVADSFAAVREVRTILAPAADRDGEGRPRYRYANGNEVCRTAWDLQDGVLEEGTPQQRKWAGMRCQIRRLSRQEQRGCLRRRRVVVIGDHVSEAAVRQHADTLGALRLRTPGQAAAEAAAAAAAASGLHVFAGDSAPSGNASVPRLLAYHLDKTPWEGDDDGASLTHVYYPSVNAAPTAETDLFAGSQAGNATAAEAYTAAALRRASHIVVSLGLHDAGVTHCGVPIFYRRLRRLLLRLGQRYRGAAVLVWAPRWLRSRGGSHNRTSPEFLCYNPFKFQAFREAVKQAAACAAEAAPASSGGSVGFIDTSFVSRAAAREGAPATEGFQYSASVTSLEMLVLMGSLCGAESTSDSSGPYSVHPGRCYAQADAGRTRGRSPEDGIGCERNLDTLEMAQTCRWTREQEVDALLADTGERSPSAASPTPAPSPVPAALPQASFCNDVPSLFPGRWDYDDLPPPPGADVNETGAARELLVSAAARGEDAYAELGAWVPGGCVLKEGQKGFWQKDRLHKCFTNRKVVFLGGAASRGMVRLFGQRAGLSETGVNRTVGKVRLKGTRYRRWRWRLHYREGAVRTERWKLKRFGLDFFQHAALHVPRRADLLPNANGTYMEAMMAVSDHVVLEVDAAYDAGESYCGVHFLFHRLLERLRWVRAQSRALVTVWASRYIEADLCRPEDGCFLCAADDAKRAAFNDVVRHAASCSKARVAVVDTSGILRALRNGSATADGTTYPPHVDAVEGAFLMNVACGGSLKSSTADLPPCADVGEVLKNLTAAYEAVLSSKTDECLQHDAALRETFEESTRETLQGAPETEAVDPQFQATYTSRFACQDHWQPCTRGVDMTPGVLDRLHKSRYESKWTPDRCELSKFGDEDLEQCLLSTKVVLVGDDLLRLVTTDLVGDGTVFKDYRDVFAAEERIGDANIVRVIGTEANATGVGGLHYYYMPSVNANPKTKPELFSNTKRPQLSEDLETADLIVLNQGMWDMGVHHCGIDVYFSRLRVFIRSLKERAPKTARIVVLGLPHLHRDRCHKEWWCYLCTNEHKVAAFREAMRLAAGCEGVGFLRTDHITREGRDETPDGAHPNVHINSVTLNMLLHTACGQNITAFAESLDHEGRMGLWRAFLPERDMPLLNATQPGFCDEDAFFSRWAAVPEAEIGCIPSMSGEVLNKCPLSRKTLKRYTNARYRSLLKK
eukprot:Rhum_TRINITY_DN16735_c0_g1::Rhum_TRINITY_DN16735_c0_g1_i1::g.164091::m.164091